MTDLAPQTGLYDLTWLLTRLCDLEINGGRTEYIDNQRKSDGIVTSTRLSITADNILTPPEREIISALYHLTISSGATLRNFAVRAEIDTKEVATYLALPWSVDVHRAIISAAVKLNRITFRKTIVEVTDDVRREIDAEFHIFERVGNDEVQQADGASSYKIYLVWAQANMHNA